MSPDPTPYTVGLVKVSQDLKYFLEVRIHLGQGGIGIVIMQREDPLSYDHKFPGDSQ